MFNSKVLKGSSYVVASTCLTSSFSGHALTGEGNFENSREGIHVDTKNATVFLESGAFLDLKRGCIIDGDFAEFDDRKAEDVLNDLASKGFVSNDEYNSIADLMEIDPRLRSYPPISFDSNARDFVEVDIENGTYLNIRDGEFVDFKNRRAIRGKIKYLIKKAVFRLFRCLCRGGVLSDDEMEKIKPLLNAKNVLKESYGDILDALFPASCVALMVFESVLFIKSLVMIYCIGENESLLKSYCEESLAYNAFLLGKKWFNAAVDAAKTIDFGQIKNKIEDILNELKHKIKKLVVELCVGEEEAKSALIQLDLVQRELDVLQKKYDELKKNKAKIPLISTTVYLKVENNNDNNTLISDLLDKQEELNRRIDKLEKEVKNSKKESSNSEVCCSSSNDNLS